MSKKALILLALLALVLASLACGDDNTGSKVGEVGPTSPPPTAAIYAVGDVVQAKDHTITLNEVKFSSGVIEAIFTVENQGQTEIVVSSMVSFSARDGDGQKLEYAIMDCGAGIDGSVLPGDKLKGSVCWNTTASDIYKIYYEANIFGTGAIVWQASK